MNQKKKGKKRKLQKNTSKKATVNTALQNKVAGTSILNTSPEQKIEHLESIHKLYKATHAIHDSVAYWTFIGTTVLTNALLSFIFIFLSVLLANPLVYIIIVIMGLGFGIVYAYVLHGMSHVMEHHHWHAKTMIIITGLINGFYIYSTSAIVREFFNMTPYTMHSIGIPVVYYISYLIPYFVIALKKN